MNDFDLRLVKMYMRNACRETNEDISIEYDLFSNKLDIIDNDLNYVYKSFSKVSLTNFKKLLSYVKSDIEFAYYRKRLKNIEINTVKESE